MKIVRASARLLATGVIALVSVLFSDGPALAELVVVTWNGGTGNWQDAANWTAPGENPGDPPVNVVPNNNGDTYGVRIDGGDGSVDSIVTLIGAATIDDILLDSGDMLNLGPGGSLTIVERSCCGNPNAFQIATIGGQINIDATSSLRFQADNTLSFAGLTGSGTVDLDGGSIISDGAELNITSLDVQGTGQLTGRIRFFSTLLADQADPLTIDPGGDEFFVGAAATMQATGAGGLRFVDGTITNNTTIQATSGSKIDLAGGATIVGGTLHATGGNQIINSDGSNTLDGVTLNGTLNHEDGTSMTILNGLTNNGTYNLNSTGAGTALSFNGNQTLAGSGQVILGTGSTNNEITSFSGTVTLEQTVRGQGTLSGGMINNATILADQDEALRINPGVQTFTNNDMMRATGAGGFRLTGGTIANNTTISALTGSKIDLGGGATIIGGTLEATGTGQIINSGINNTLDGVTLDGPVDHRNARVLTVLNGLTNNGIYSLNSTGGLTDLLFEGAQTIGGNGQVVLGAGSLANRITTNDTILTNAVDHTIRGQGQLLAFTGGMINDGTIIADQAGTLTIFPNDLGFTNNGMMQATGAGGLLLAGGTFTNTAIIEALDSSRVTLSGGMTMLGGTLQSAGSGQVLNSGNVTLDGVTLDGTFNQVNNTTVTVLNGITNNGTYNLNSTGNPTTLAFNGDQTIGGNGQIVMGDGSANRISPLGASIVTNGVNHTIRGHGELTASIINDGTIIADRAAPMTLRGFTNNGTMQATGAGGFRFIGGTYNNNGTVEIFDGSILELSSIPTIIDGTLQTFGSGRIDASSNATLDGVTVDGTFNLPGGRALTILNGLTNDGLLAVNSNNSGSEAHVMFANDGVLDGTGVVFMNRPGRFAQLNTAPGVTVTHAAGHTIRGIGDVHAAMLNNGIVESGPGFGTGQLTLLTNNKTNNGIIRASSGIELEIDGIVVTQSATGRIIGDESNVEIRGGAHIVGGRLETVGAGTIYTTGGPGAALTDVTNLGTYHLRGGAPLTVGGSGLTNDGTLSVNSNVSGAEAHLLFSSDAMLDGTGVVFLNNTGRFAQVNTAPGVTVTQAAGHTIRGTGQINAALVNNGLVESAPVAATSGLVLQTNDKTNNHVFRAAGGVELEINGITVTQNATGRIIADESNVEITAGAHIVGGTLETVGAGTVFTTASATLSGVTNQGTYHVRGGAELMIIGGGGLTNHGVLTVNSNNAGSEAHLLFTTNAMLGGTGEVVLNTSGRFAQLNTAPAAFVTNGPEHTIRGLGQVNGNVINDGRMEGNSGTELLEINGFVGGSGVLQDVRIDGTHSPGASPAAVDLEGVYSIASIGKLIIEIGGPAPGSQHDQLNSIGMVNLNGLLDVLSIDAGAGTFIPALGQEFRIITSNNPILGTFRNATGTSRAGLTNIEWDIVYRTNEVLLQVTGLSVVPEPGTLILELTALAACLFLRRRFS